MPAWTETNGSCDISTNTKLPFEILLSFFVFLFTQNSWDKFSNKHVCQLYLYVILLRDFDSSIWEHMLLPPEHCFLHKHCCENSETLLCIFSYKKLFIWIQEHLIKPLTVLITSNAILFILSDKLNFCSLWTFPNISILDHVIKWG